MKIIKSVCDCECHKEGWDGKKHGGYYVNNCSCQPTEKPMEKAKKELELYNLLAPTPEMILAEYKQKLIKRIRKMRKITQPMFQDIRRLSKKERQQDLLDCEYNQALDDIISELEGGGE